MLISGLAYIQELETATETVRVFAVRVENPKYIGAMQTQDTSYPDSTEQPDTTNATYISSVDIATASTTARLVDTPVLSYRGTESAPLKTLTASAGPPSSGLLSRLITWLRHLSKKHNK